MSAFFSGNNGRDVTALDRDAAIGAALQDSIAVRSKEVRKATQPLLDDPSALSGIAASGVGRVLAGASQMMGFDLFDNGGLTDVPMNFSPREQLDQIEAAYPQGAQEAFESDTRLGKNNLEGLLEMTNDIPDEDRMFILSSPNWGEFKNRLTMYRLNDPMFEQDLSLAYGGTSPLWTAFAADAAAITAMAYATEPLAWLGTAGRIARGGTAAATAAGASATAVAATTVAGRTAILAAQLAKTPAVIGLAETAGRYAALGVIDQTIINAARFGFDDSYHRTNTEMATEYAFAAALSAGIGGPLGRSMANKAMREYAASAFSTLPISPVNAATEAAAAGAAAVPGYVSTNVVSGTKSISQDQATGLAMHLRAIGADIGEFVRDMRSYGILKGNSLNAIPNEPAVLRQVNAWIAAERIARGYKGPAVNLSHTVSGTNGARTIAQRAVQIAESLQTRLNGSRIVRPQSLAERAATADEIVAHLLSDMRDAGLNVKALKDIADDADTLAQVDAWFNDIENGYNSPFGFKRNQQSRGYGWTGEQAPTEAMGPQTIDNVVDDLVDQKLADQPQGVPDASVSVVTKVDRYTDLDKLFKDILGGDQAAQAQATRDIAGLLRQFPASMRERIAARILTFNAKARAARPKKMSARAIIRADKAEVDLANKINDAVKRGTDELLAQDAALAETKASILESRAIPNEPTPGTTLSIQKYGLERDGQLSIEATVAGRKPLTKLSSAVDFASAKEKGLVEYPHPSGKPNDESKIFGLPNKESRKAAKEYYAALKTGNSVERTTKIGELYGYTKKEIADFVSGETTASNLEKLAKLKPKPPEAPAAPAASGTAATPAGTAATATATPGATAVPAAPAPASGSISGAGSAKQILPAIPHKKAVTPLPGNTAGAANAVEALDKAVPVNNIRLPLLSRFLNQAAELLTRDANPFARLFAYRAFDSKRLLVDAVTGLPVPQPYTVFERTRNMMDIALAEHARRRQAYFYRYLLNRGAADQVNMADVVRTAFGGGKRQAMLEFEDRAWRSMVSGTPDANDMVNGYATDLRQILDHLADTAHNEGVEGFQNWRRLQNYFPRLYDFDRFQRLGATPQGRIALERVLAQALETAPGSRELRIFDPVTGAYNIYRFNDIPAAARALADRMLALASNYEQSPMTQWDQMIIDAIESMHGPLRDTAGSPSPRGRSRIIMNELAEVDVGQDFLGTGTTVIRFADLLNRDTTNVLKRYATSVLGATNERMLLNILEQDLWHLGFRERVVGGHGGNLRLRFANIAEFQEFASREGALRGRGALSPTELEQLERITRDLQFRPRVDTAAYGGRYFRNNANIWSAGGVSIMKSATFLLYAGKFTAAAAGEIARPMANIGVIATIRKIPIALDMMRSWNDMTIEQQGLTRLLDQFGIATDRLRRVTLGTPDAEVRFSRRPNAVRGLAAVTDAYSDITLLGPVTSFTQFLTGITTLQHLFEAGARGGRRLDDATIMTLGLTRQEYDAAVNFMATNAVTVRRAGRDGVVDINNMNHPDFDIIRRVMDRMVRSSIQDVPTLGETSAWADTAFGTLLTQFRNYNIKAVDNLLLKNYSKVWNAQGAGGKTAAGINVARQIAFSFVMAGLIKQGLSVLDLKNAEAAGDYKKMEEIEGNIGLKGFMKQGLLGPGELWLPVMATEIGWNTVSDQPLLSQYRTSASDMASFPALELAQRVGSVTKDTGGALSKEFFPSDSNPFKRFITRKTTDNAFKLVPGQNWPLIARYLGITEEQINDYYDLPYEQPRK